VSSSSSRSHTDTQADRRAGWLAAADTLSEPYPEDIFTPLSDEETRAAVAAMDGAVRHASERMHAAWARHWAEVLRKEAADA